MATNPLISQGTLNKLRGSIVVPEFPELNVTAPFLANDMISLALQGASTVRIPTGTGIATSPQPYMDAVLTVHLLRTNGLGAAYKTQMEVTTLLGDGIVITPDSSALPPYVLFNCSIDSVQEMNFAGRDASWVVTIGGIYYLNAEMWALS